MTYISFEDRVGNAIKLLGFTPQRGGWPDFAIFDRAGDLKMLIEVKAPGDYVSARQRRIHAALAARGIEVRVIRHENYEAFLKELDAMDRGIDPSPPPKPVTFDDVADAIDSLSYCVKDRPALCDPPDADHAPGGNHVE